MNAEQEIRAKAVELMIKLKGYDEIAHAINKQSFEYTLFEDNAIEELAEYITTGKKPEVKA